MVEHPPERSSACDRVTLRSGSSVTRNRSSSGRSGLMRLARAPSWAWSPAARRSARSRLSTDSPAPGAARRRDSNGKAVAHDDALDVVIEERGDDGVLEAADDDDVVDELVVVAAHPEHALSARPAFRSRPTCRRRPGPRSRDATPLAPMCSTISPPLASDVVEVFVEDLAHVAPAIGVTDEQPHDALRLPRLGDVEPPLHEARNCRQVARPGNAK